MKSQKGRTKLSPQLILLGVLIFLSGCKAYYPDPEELREARDMEDQFGTGLCGPREIDRSPDDGGLL